ncbi:sensor histidine kinase [Taibaiella soli]|uniref:histidine kinase n=1 Tax=Taibaiella soli TaxID=1649169 RepID=A0A2W2AM37_9BACT|nr:HAMP domain-containing sensor histidine kinase [Taibaiella soli]PZF73370.1 hypothetical protein DN068_08240 [Taibaiella soli]
MKLFTRYSQLNIAVTIGIFLLGSCTFYFLIRYVLINELDSTLYTEQQEITEYAREHNALMEILPANDQFVTYRMVDKPVVQRFDNTELVVDQRLEPFREVAFGLSVKGNNYLITVSKPLKETQKLLAIIILVSILMIGLILLVSSLINRRLLHKLWQPFYNTIEKVKGYKVAQKGVLELEETKIDEFSLLNQSITAMTERVQQDYASLKEFTSHAAHEMQTPLAVIRGKLDMLVQNEAVLKNNPTQISDIEKAVHKLSRLYQALLLLTKVENRQFILNEPVEIHEIIEEKLVEFSELMESRKIDLQVFLKPVDVVFHNQLAEIVIGNLFYNAIRYNKPGGKIEISLDLKRLMISNTSAVSMLDNDRLFQRFYRHEEVKEDGNGLGLSIVKQICDMAGYQLFYFYTEDSMHTFEVYFDR